jgi:hypothetical protein
MYAIARTQKHKMTSALIAGLHNARTSPRFSKDVDLERTKYNSILVGTNSPITDINNRLIEQGFQNRRKDAVVAVEVLLTASPEYFKTTDETRKRYKFNHDWDAEKTIEFTRVARLWAENYFKENLVNCALHLDEKTPHLQLMVTPITEDHRLSAKDMFDRKGLQDMQTSYARAVERLGLERGVSSELTGRRHDPVKNWHKPIEAPKPIKAPEKGFLGYSTEQVQETVKQANDTINKLNAELELAKRQVKTAKDALAASAAKNDYLISTKESVEAENAKLRAFALKETSRLREIELTNVLIKMGAENIGGQRWQTQAGIIRTNDDNSFDGDQKGRGAIDLVAKVMGINPQDAIHFLGREFGHGAAVAAAAVSSETIAKDVLQNTVAMDYAPVHSEQKWQAVSEQLEQKGMPKDVIEQLRQQDRLRADVHGNAVYVDHDSKYAEVHASHKVVKMGNKDGFFTVIGAKAKEVVTYVRDAFTAIASLYAQGGQGTVRSIGGDKFTPNQAAVKNKDELVVAQDQKFGNDNDIKLFRDDDFNPAELMKDRYGYTDDWRLSVEGGYARVREQEHELGGYGR